jgi:hypothetical protein
MYKHIDKQTCTYIYIGERVDTEDDILHIRNLPDFDGTLGNVSVILLLGCSVISVAFIIFMCVYFTSATYLAELYSSCRA